MQILVEVTGGITEYVEQKLYLQIRAPSRCPNCGSYNCLGLLGYYARWCTDLMGTPMAIKVRRFMCSQCPGTVSCLPHFAQPYRLINNGTVEKFVAGDTRAPDVQHLLDLLQRYWRKFERWTGLLRETVGSTFGRVPRKDTAAGLWQRVITRCGSLAKATMQLTRKFRITCWGKYHCHQPAMQTV